MRTPCRLHRRLPGLARLQKTTNDLVINGTHRRSRLPQTLNPIARGL
jgi:hypothetical protein